MSSAVFTVDSYAEAVNNGEILAGPYVKGCL